MIGKIIAAVIGDKVARRTKGVSGAGGAALGVVAATVLRRISLPAMIALAAGGYAVKKYGEKGKRTKASGIRAR